VAHSQGHNLSAQPCLHRKEHRLLNSGGLSARLSVPHLHLCFSSPSVHLSLPPATSEPRNSLSQSFLGPCLAQDLSI
jgi:hypothetical protein